MASANKIIGGLGKVGERLFSKAVPLSSADKALPLVLPRANLSSEFINSEAERVARQMLGEHVTSGRPKETFNLAGRSMKESERVKGLDYVLKPTGTVAKEVPYSPKRGEVKVALPGDQTVSDKTLESLEGVPIDSPQQGGAYYGLGQKHLDDPEFWKSGESAAKGLQGKVDRVADYYEPDRVVGTHLAMGQTANNFAMHFADANLKAIDWSKASPKKISVFDNIVAGGYVDNKGNRVTFPNWPGLADPEAALKEMSGDSNLRKWFNNRMKVPSITEPLGLPNGLDIQYAITEPRVRDMEINMTGLMTGDLKPGALVEAAGTPHNTYTHRILGEAQGPQEVLTPFSIDFPDAAEHIASTKRPADFTGTIQKVYPHQVVDDQYINQYNEYRDRIKQLTGKKDGGAIHGDDQELKAMIADHLDSQSHDQELRAMVDNHLAGGGAPEPVNEGFKKLAFMSDGGSTNNLSKAAQENLAILKELRGKIAPVADAWAAKQAEDANKYTRDIQPFKMPINKAAGGKMVKGAGKVLKNLFEDAPVGKIIEAPSLMLPSRLSDLKNTVRAQKGEYGARRVERAADEIPNLENLYKEEALKRVFTGDNARALMTMNPADFEKYSAPLDPRFMSEHSTRFTTSGERLGYPDYMESYLPNVGAFNDVPFLEINKKQQGSTAAPFISGHEGRHRNRVLAGKGETSGLVQLLPRAELREPFPRRSQEDYLDALKKELELTRNMVKPETYPDNFKQVDIKRPAIELPDIYAKGGIAHMASAGKVGRGIVKGVKSIFGGADEVAPAIQGGTRRFGEQAGGNNIIKETGGNWLGGSAEKALKPLRRRTAGGDDPVSAIEKLNKSFPDATKRPEYVDANIARLQQDAALNKWVDSNLTNYVKKQMSTAEDPVRKLFEEGIVHYPVEDVGAIKRYGASEARQKLGQPQLGQSETAKAWEDASDAAINPFNVSAIKTAKESQGVGASLYEPWMEKAGPSATVNRISPIFIPSNLGFDHIMDVLRQDVAAGRIRPEQLNKVSMEQAVRRTHEFDQEMAKRMAETQVKNTAGMPVHKEYPDKGYKWLQLSQPEDLPKGWSKEASGAYVGPNGERTIVNPSRQTLEDSLKYEGDTMGHCVGSYCDDVAEGNSQIYSLRDAKGEPHVTIEVQPNNHLDFNSWWEKQTPELKDKINARARSGAHNMSVFEAPEYIAARNAMPPVIKQIKGKGNAAPKEEYLPFVQDFVRSGEWSQVGDLNNTGLIYRDGKYLTPAEDSDLLLKELGIPPEGMAEGGGAFKKIQFMDKGGVTTSGGDFSAEDVGADSYFSDEFKRRLAGLKEDSKTQMEKEYKQLSRAGGKKDLALRVGAQLAGGLPDILNMGLEGVDYLQSKVPALSRPASVLDVANSKDRVPKFSLSSENPWLGSERIMDSLKEAKLLGDNEYPFMELASNFAVPVGASALIKGGKKTAKGVKAMTSKPQGGLSATAR